MNGDAVLQTTLDGAIKMPEKRRIWEIDALRGFCVLLMLIDHMFADAQMYGYEWFGIKYVTLDGAIGGFMRAAVWYWGCDARTVIHPVIVFLFIFMCGLSCGFSKSNLKRGIWLLIVALGVTAVTVNFDDGSSAIRFGILHLLSFGIITWSVVDAICGQNKKTKLIVGLSMACVVFLFWIILLGNPCLNGKISQKIFFLTETEYSRARSPADLFTVIPWAGILYLGAALTAYVYPDKKTLCSVLDKPWHKPLCFIGRHALLIYVVHTVLIMFILELVGRFGITGEWTYL